MKLGRNYGRVIRKMASNAPEKGEPSDNYNGHQSKYSTRYEAVDGGTVIFWKYGHRCLLPRDLSHFTWWHLKPF